LTLEGYTMYEDEWNKGDEGCRVNSEGDWFPHKWQIHDEEMNIPDFIAAVKPKPTVDLRGKFIPCTEEQHEEVYHLLEKLGYKQWDSPFAEWIEEWSDGVYVSCEGECLCIHHQDEPTLTLEELREIAKNVKL